MFGRLAIVKGGRRSERFFDRLLLGLGQLRGFLLFERVNRFIGLCVFAFDVLVIDELDYFIERSVDVGLPTLAERLTQYGSVLSVGATNTR